MGKVPFVVLAAIVLALLPLCVSAETKVITVGNMFYDPNDLTIQAGDTVRWVYAGSSSGCDPYYGCGSGEGTAISHTVTADDGSFSSGKASPKFIYEHVFNAAGEVLYHCEVHSAPGLDRNFKMNGRITVQAADSTFLINEGLNDAWYNPATAGQGFFVTVFPDIQMMFLAWFTYDTERPPIAVGAMLGEPGHRWITAFGPYAADRATLNVELTQGGVFNMAEPPVAQNADGTIEVIFSSCNSGMINYDITSAAVSGQAPIERIALDNVPFCETLKAAP